MSTAGTPVAYALVSLQPSLGSRFADTEGRFTFVQVRAGRYRLQVRQVGYQPLDTAFTVDSLNIELRLVMTPLALRLDSIVVAVSGPCRRPGPPDSGAAPRVHALLDQLRISAERFQLLSDSFPFYYDFERTMVDLSASGTVLRRIVDTARYRSDTRRSYLPGGVVAWGRGAESGRRVIHLPTLAHFADSTFVWSHCWTAAEAGEDSLVALRFRPVDSIIGADIEGTVFLDAAHYQLRRAELYLTRVTRALPTAAAVTSVMTFRELYPGLVLPATIAGTTRAAIVPGMTRRVWTATEDQRLLRVNFLRAFRP